MSNAVNLTTESYVFDDVELAWLTPLAVSSNAPLALLLHGFPDSAHSWNRLISVLVEQGYRPVAPWSRGYAPSGLADNGVYQVGALADDVCKLHEHLGGDSRAVIVGHDWGATATYAATNWQPDRFSAAIALAVPPAPVMFEAIFRYEQLKLSWYMHFFQSPIAETVVAADHLAFLDRLWSDWSPGIELGEELSNAKDALSLTENLSAALGYYRATLGGGPTADRYADAQTAWAAPGSVRTLYIHGENDGCIAFDSTEGALQALGAGSRVEQVKNAGHFMHLEQPELIEALIIDFLNE